MSRVADVSAADERDNSNSRGRGVGDDDDKHTRTSSSQLAATPPLSFAYDAYGMSVRSARQTTHADTALTSSHSHSHTHHHHVNSTTTTTTQHASAARPPLRPRVSLRTLTVAGGGGSGATGRSSGGDGGGGGGGGMAGASDERRNVFSSSSTRDAVLAYLEATDRHDVVAAMLQDEAVAHCGRPLRRHAHDNNNSRHHHRCTPLHDDDDDADESAMAAHVRRRRRQQRVARALLLRGLEYKHAAQQQQQRQQDASATAAAAVDANATSPRVWRAAHVLRALHGLERGALADMALLHADFTAQLAAQRALHGLPALTPDMVALLAAQTRVPLWSADDVAATACAPPPASAATGRVLLGSVNSLVEQLTCVRVTPGRAASATQRAHALAFRDAFLRQHRHLVSSRALLAKLLERAQVPLSLRLGTRHFCAHGITIHVTRGHDGVARHRRRGSRRGDGVDDGADGRAAARHTTTSSSAAAGALPLWRSQSEAVTQHTTASPSSTRAATTTTTTTTYSMSGTLWLTVLRHVQTRVLTTLLYWLQQHPCHFDALMRQCVLHMAEYAALQPTVWSDCPPAYAQLGAALRDAVVYARGARARVASLLRLRLRATSMSHARRLHDDNDSSNDDTATGVTAAALRVSSLLRLSRMGYAERAVRLHEATPPTLRDTSRDDDSDSDSDSRNSNSSDDDDDSDDSDVETTRLPLFVLQDLAEGDVQLPFTTMPSSSLHHNTAAAAAASGDDDDDVYDARRRCAEAALRDFFARGSDAYVKALTAAHQRLFCAFDVDDVRALSYRYTPSYVTSTRVRRSRLGVFLHTSAELTRWTTSLALHAAFLDAVLANAARREALTLTASFVDGGAAIDAAAAALAAAGGNNNISSSSGNTSMAGNGSRLVAGDAVVVVGSDDDDDSDSDSLARHTHSSDDSRRGSSSNSSSSRSSSSSGSSRDSDSGHDDSRSDERSDGDAAVQPLPPQRRRSDVDAHNKTSHRSSDDDEAAAAQSTQQQRVAMEAHDGVGGAHHGATALSTSFVRRDGSGSGSRAAALDAVTTAAATTTTTTTTVVKPVLPSLGKLFVRVLHRVMELVVGFLRVNNVHASYSVFRGLQHPYVLKLLNHPLLARRIGAHTLQQLRHLDSFYAADARYSVEYVDDDDSNNADNKDNNDARGRGGRPTAMRRTHHRMRHTFREYLNAVSDNAEFPTVPLLQHYLSELHLLHTLEPTLLTTPHRGYGSRYMRYTSSDDDDDDDAHAAPPASSTLTLVHWRKLFIEDEILQRIAAFQKACHHYVWSTSTVLRSIVRDVDVEAAYAAQLRDTLVRDSATLRALASELLTILAQQEQQQRQQSV